MGFQARPARRRLTVATLLSILFSVVFATGAYAAGIITDYSAIAYTGTIGGQQFSMENYIQSGGSYANIAGAVGAHPNSFTVPMGTIGLRTRIYVNTGALYADQGEVIFPAAVAPGAFVTTPVGLHAPVGYYYRAQGVVYIHSGSTVYQYGTLSSGELRAN
jgi:hypothetical protein